LDSNPQKQQNSTRKFLNQFTLEQSLNQYLWQKLMDLTTALMEALLQKDYFNLICGTMNHINVGLIGSQ
jgi:hypothetical protein